MLELSMIRDTVMQVAEAITAALEIETEIINSRLMIIGGTGRYTAKIGSYEEKGDLNSGQIYGALLRSGKTYLCTDTAADPFYAPQEGELAEISCPIKLDGTVIGLIGLVAFTKEQQTKIHNNHETLLLFLERMADLIASKLSETEKRNQLNGILESMHEGLIALDKNESIVSCNYQASHLLGLERQMLENRPLSDVWKMDESIKAIRFGQATRDKEILYRASKNGVRRFLCTVIPLGAVEANASDATNLGAMILFQDVSDARVRLYKLTGDEKRTSFDDIVGSSDVMETIKRRTLQVASSDSTVLITGESGTGKELFARAIHNASPRREEPFVTIHCGAIPEMLLESELFGYEKGAFTGADSGGKPGKFELADRGTIFLDEIGDLPLHLQVKLLHAIQNRKIERVGGVTPIDINVRIVAATNQNLEEMIETKEFREDLFFRLNVIPLIIPPLRERRKDIELLLNNALHKFNGLLHKNVLRFHPDSLEALLRYPWPGNVRELENVVEYAVNMESGDEIELENLPAKILKRTIEGKGRQRSLKELVDEYQKQLITSCLDETGRSTEGKILAAELLEISESTLYRRLRELGIR